MKHLILSSVICAALLSCKPRSFNEGSAVKDGPTGKKGFDVNDVSYLFPLSPGDNLPVPNITFNEAMFPKKTLEQVLAFAKSKGFQLPPEVEKYDTWHVLGFRFDPCFPKAPSKSFAEAPAEYAKCIMQFRLIAQPYSMSATDNDPVQRPRPMDYALHLVYQPVATPGLLPATNPHVQGLIKLRDKARAAFDTFGRPMGRHPALAKSIGLGDMIRDYVASVAKVSALKGVAAMVLESPFSAIPWDFYAGQVNGNGDWNVVDVPMNPGAKMLSFHPGGRRPPSVTPQPVQALNSFKFFGNAAQMAQAERLKLHEIDNPQITHFGNMDCVSCHTTTTLLINKFVGTLEGDKLFLSPNGITGFVEKSQLQNRNSAGWSVRNFGYFGLDPSISTRTAAESAEVAKFMNENVTHEDNPGLQCSPQKMRLVWKCSVPDAKNFEECAKL